MTRMLIFAGCAFGLFALLFGLEMWRVDEPVTTGEIVGDLLETALLAGAVTLTALTSIETREFRRERQRLVDDLARARRDGEQWRSTVRDYLEGLASAINRQFGDWRLTQAESEIAMLMLKGFSHKEIARMRNCSAATIRQHATSIYRKSGLSSRAQMTAYFLEDLLPSDTSATFEEQKESSQPTVARPIPQER